MSGYLLIQVEPGQIDFVRRAVRGFDDVSLLEVVKGPYDLIALVEAPDVEEPSVHNQVTGLRGVIRAVSCSVN